MISASLLLFAMAIPSDIRHSTADTQNWAPKKASLMTRWAKDVSPLNTHPEYPRPQMVRKDWMNLNGLWDLVIRQAPGPGPDVRGSAGFKGKVLVPFPVESALSGVMKPVAPADELVYRRTFKVPAKWKGKRVLLHFGAVDWSSTVLVNGKEVGSHIGGYDPFSFDVTEFLTKSGEQSLEVVVRDPSEESTQPHGKQYLKNEGIWYTPTSGIWQTVWLEPVNDTYVKSFTVSADPKTEKATFHFQLNRKAERRMMAAVRVNSRTAPYFTYSSIEEGEDRSKPVVLHLPNPKLWTPDSPNLYSATVELLSDESGEFQLPEGVMSTVDFLPEDKFDTYFAFRTISLGKDKQGRTRICLNGKPYFLIGPLDQGFWPDGLYTAPTDEAMKYDLEVTKKLGFNFIRKHVKVEPARWYYYCDKMGIAVFQDMPSGDKYIGGNDPDITRTAESGENFKAELAAMIRTHFNHPCIVGWVPYNEGWGQWETPEIVKYIRGLDNTRLIDSASGWTDRGVGDMHDIHVYPGPGSPKPEAKRAAFLGEFGGLGLPVPGHMWKATGWGYQTFKDKEELTAGFEHLLEDLRFLIDQPGVSGAVYTQTTDVETELNGFMTYDRAMIKMDEARVLRAVKSLFLPPPKMTVLVPTSELVAQDWKYASDLSDPSDLSWAQPGFDDSSWKRGKGGFGTEQTPGAIVGTRWDTGDIWLRREIVIPAGKRKILKLRIHHDEDASVFIDGKLLIAPKRYTTGYVNLPIPQEAMTPGKHMLAVHCHQTAGGQFIDVGFVEIEG